jgi:type II secretory pathway component PulL
MATLAGVLPMIASNTDITVKVISYSSETGDMSVSVQAHSFNSVDALRQTISSQGYNAELQGVNAQGDVTTGRLKISKPQH